MKYKIELELDISDSVEWDDARMREVMHEFVSELSHRTHSPEVALEDIRLFRQDWIEIPMGGPRV